MMTKTVCILGISVPMGSHDGGVTWFKRSIDDHPTNEPFKEPASIQKQVGVRVRATTSTRPAPLMILKGKIVKVTAPNATKKRHVRHAQKVAVRNHYRIDKTITHPVPLYAADIVAASLKTLLTTHMPKDGAGGLQIYKPITSQVKEG